MSLLCVSCCSTLTEVPQACTVLELDVQHSIRSTMTMELTDGSAPSLPGQLAPPHRRMLKFEVVSSAQAGGGEEVRCGFAPSVAASPRWAAACIMQLQGRGAQPLSSQAPPSASDDHGDGITLPDPSRHTEESTRVGGENAHGENRRARHFALDFLGIELPCSSLAPACFGASTSQRLRHGRRGEGSRGDRQPRTMRFVDCFAEPQLVGKYLKIALRSRCARCTSRWHLQMVERTPREAWI